MPIIRKDENGNIVKEGPNGCVDCGFSDNNKKIIETPEKAKETAPVKTKASKKKEEVNKDDS